MFEKKGAHRRPVLREFLCAAACAVGLAVASTTPVSAASLNLSGGTAGSIPGGANNEFIPLLFAGPTIGGFYGAQIYVDATSSSTLTIQRSRQLRSPYPPSAWALA